MITTPTNRNSYPGNGLATSFPYAFKITNAAHMKVILRDAEGVDQTLDLGVDYTVDGVGSDDGGTVTLTSVTPAIGEAITLKRVVPITQTTDFKNQGNFFASRHEDAYDKQVMIAQDLDEKISRCAQMPEGLYPTFDATIPTPVPRYALVVNEDATGFDMVPSVAADQTSSWTAAIAAAVVQVLSQFAASAGSGLVGFIQSGAGAIARTVQSKLRDTVSVKDFGAIGDGVYDDTSAFSAALVASSRVFVPSGTYLVAGVSLPSGSSLVGNGTLKLKALGTGVYTPIINVTGPGVTIDGLKFNGNRTAQFANSFADAFDTGPGGTGKANRCAIKADNNGGSTIYNLRVINCDFTLMWGASIATRDVSGVFVDGCRFSNCNFEGCYLYATNSSVRNLDCKVVNCTFRDIGSGDGTVNADCCVFSAADSPVFANNSATNFERDMVKFEGCNYALAQGNVCDTNTLAFYAIQFQSGGIGHRAIGNNLKNVYGGVLATSGVFTDLDVSHNLVVGRDPGAGTIPDGVAVSGCTRVMIAHNRVRNIYRMGIQVQDCSDVTIRGNEVYGNTSTALNGIGIYLIATGADQTYVIVSGNKVGPFVNATSVGNGGISIYAPTKKFAYIRLENNFVETMTNTNVSHGIYTGSTMQIDVLDVYGNTVLGTIELYPSGVQAFVGNNALRLINKSGFGNIRGQGAAAPASGSYYIGDIWLNNSPASAGYIGWICTAAGSPGTWKGFGLIA